MKLTNNFSKVLLLLFLIITSVFGSKGLHAVCPSSITNYWTFDTDSETSTIDIIGSLNAESGILSSEAPSGIVNVSRYFDGASGYDFIDYSSHDWNLNLTVGLWFKTNSTVPDSLVMLGSFTENNTSWWIGIEELTGYPVFCLYDNLGAGTDVKGSFAVNDDAWHFLAGSYDATSEYLTLYLDGSIVGQVSHTYSGNFQTDEKLTMGYLDRLGIASHFFTGSLDEVALFNTSLDEAELDELYIKGNGGLDYCVELVSPSITSSPLTTVLQSTAYNYTVVATGNPTPEYSLAVAPTGMTIDAASGHVSWIPTSSGTFDVEVEASNIIGTANQNFSIVVSESSAPVISSVAVTSGLQNQLYSYTVAASGTPAPEFSLLVSPVGMTINITTGEISWTPTTNGVFDVTVVATNEIGSDTQEFTITVDELIQPSITSTAVTTILQFEVYAYTVIATGNPLPEFSLLTSPPGMSIDPVSGAISWIPDDFGDFDISVEAFNIGGSDIQNFTITVEELILPAITSLPEQRTMVNEVYTYNIVAEGYPEPELTLETGPTGMNLNTATGVLTWSPSATGIFPVTISATNKGGTVEQHFNLEVLEPCMANLVSYLTFAEGSGATTKDEAHPRVLNVAGNAAWTSGRVGSGLIFNGTSNYLTIGDDEIFDWSIDQDFSIELWCRIENDKDGIQVMIGRETSSSTHWWLGMDAAKKATFFLFDETRAGGGIAGTTSINDGNWHHLAAVHESSNGRNSLYVDGVLEATDAYNYTADFNSAEDIHVAGFYSGGQYRYHFKGILDEIAISNRILEESDIMEHVLKGNNAYGYCQYFTLTPTIISEPPTTIMVDNLYEYQLVAEGVPAPTYSLQNSPAGMSINSASGMITWVPSSPGVFEVTARATNSAGSDNQIFTVRVLEICMDNLISFLKFDESAGSVTSDEAHPRQMDVDGNANWTSGRIGSALSFDGISDYLAFSDDPDFDWSHNQDFTVELWFKSDGKSGLQVFIGRETAASTHWWLGINENQRLAFFLFDEARIGGGMTSSTQIQDNNWHHLAAVHISSSGQNLLYLDGELEADTNFAYTSSFASASDIQIANFFSAASHKYFFEGALDEIAVSNRSLTHSEVQEHYVKGLSSEGYCDEFSLAPLITSEPVTSVLVNTQYSYTVEAYGIPTPTFSLQTAPSGMSIDPFNGEITWIPTSTGTYNVIVRATNSAGSVTQSFSLRVAGSCMSDLISFLKFSEGAGTITVDEADTRIITVEDNANWSEGIVDNAVSFNGLSQFLSLPDHENFDWSVNEDFSIEFWCKTIGTSGGLQVIIGRETNESTHWWVGINEHSQVSFYLFDESHTGGGITSSISINDGAWHHIIAQHNADQGQNTLFIDSKMAAHGIFNYSSGFNSDEAIQIANFYTNGAHRYFYNGILDELAISNRLLTDDEIHAHFIKGSYGTDYCSDFSLAPTITSTPDTLAVINSIYTYTLNATGLPLPTFSIIDAPSGMTIDPVNGTITWEPATGGTYNVVVQASNSAGTQTQEFSILVLETCMDNLISYLRFSENTGTLTYDDANPRIIDIEDQARWTDGRVETGLSFDGSTEYLSFPDHPDFDWTNSQDFSIELWARTNDRNHDLQVLVGRETSGSTHWWIGITEEKKAAFYLFDEEGTGGGLVGKDSINDGEWHHIAAVHLSEGNRNLLYIDGSLEADTIYAYESGFNSVADIQIANFFTSGQHRYLYQGDLDEIAVLNRELTDFEVYASYLKGVNNIDYCQEYTVQPNIISFADTITMANQQYNYQVEADGLPKPSFILTESPEGMSIDPVTGLISWFPEDAGEYNVIVTASNSEGSAFQNYILEVREPCMDELITYMAFSEGVGDNSTDLANLQLISVVDHAEWTDGIAGYGLSFNGIDDGISIPADTDLNWAKNQDFTIELWFNTSVDAENVQVFIGRDVPDSTHWWIGLNTDYQPVFYLYDKYRNGGGVVGTNAMNDGEWHHIAAVYGSAAGSLSLYIDGALIAEESYDYETSFNSTAQLHIGRLYFNARYNFNFNGKLDEIAISNRIIPVDEIYEHYLMGINEAGYCDDIILIPTITSVPKTDALMNSDYSYDVDAMGLPIPSFELVTPPEGMSIDSVSGVISWRPQSYGEFEIEVRALNTGGYDSQVYTLSVLETCIPEGVSYFNFEENSGATVEDQFTERQGASFNSPVRENGIIGQSMMFDGINQYISIPHHSDFDFQQGTSFSIELWCKPDPDNANLQVFIGRNETEGIHWWLGKLDDSGLPAFYLYDENRTGNGVTGTLALNDGKWHHLAAIYDASLNKMSLYIDGSLNGNFDYTFGSGFASSSDLQIGSLFLDDTYQFYYEGGIDEVVIYNRAISHQDIQLHYELGLVGAMYCFSEILAIPDPQFVTESNHSIYPVPASNELFVELNDEYQGELTIQLINALGVYIDIDEHIYENKIKLNTSSLSEGFYILRILYEDRPIIQDCVIISR